MTASRPAAGLSEATEPAAAGAQAIAEFRFRPSPTRPRFAGSAPDSANDGYRPERTWSRLLIQRYRCSFCATACSPMHGRLARLGVAAEEVTL